ncbi:MAG: YegS/Rv2252/BmrU family lipid kinase [Alphaproteobacteria bacterium]|nr:YegS/Rv2252/BmrU family lipid kinase [Alphaproteobacteria bacterium]
MSDICVVFNPTAGARRRRRLHEVLASLTARKIPFYIKETRAAGDARRIAAELPETTGAVVVAGGDGTINEVLNGLAAGKADSRALPELALVPMGTANVLAAEIGLTDLSSENIARTIVGGQRRDVYLGRAADHYFAQMCGVGFDAHVVANVDLKLKRRLKKLAYVLSSLIQIWRYVPRHYTVTIDGQAHDAASVIVANGHYYAGRFSCAPQARIDESRLYVCLFRRAGRRHVIRYAWGLLSGRLRHFPDVQVVPAEKVVIENTIPSDRGEPVQGDGDIIAVLPATIAAGAARLTMRCPA